MSHLTQRCLFSRMLWLRGRKTHLGLARIPLQLPLHLHPIPCLQTCCRVLNLRLKAMAMASGSHQPMSVTFKRVGECHPLTEMTQCCHVDSNSPATPYI